MKTFSFQTAIFLMAAAILSSASFGFAKDSEKQKKNNVFLSQEKLPNAVAFLPPPATVESAAFCGDKAAYEAGKAIRETPRGERAREDDSDKTKYFAQIFSEACHFTISKETTPETFELIKKVAKTADLATDGIKAHYKRVRPYAQFNEPSLIPEKDEKKRNKPSYPSGHATTGWAVTLVLVELFPECADSILAVGYEYGQSRVISGFHYQSDVDASRTLASAVIARLHADETFDDQLDDAEDEIEKIKKHQKKAEKKSKKKD